jgi:iron(III) dicitrate ABC transporter, ATP-binding protein FecE
MIEVRNLSFSYSKTKILDGINLKVEERSLCALVGSNGSGKSTLLSCCMNFLRPSGGEIFINGTYSLDKNPNWMSKNIAFVPQQRTGVFGFSVLEIVLMARSRFMSGMAHRKNDIQKAKEALEMVGIYHLKDKAVTNLSGGERQLVFIARALAQECSTIILDEPTSELDFKNQILFWQICKKISKDSAVFVCTHDPNHALWFCDDIVGVKKGKVVVSGKTSEAMSEENLRIIYDRECKILEQNEIKFITPDPKLFGAMTL